MGWGSGGYIHNTALLRISCKLVVSCMVFLNCVLITIKILNPEEIKKKKNPQDLWLQEIRFSASSSICISITKACNNLVHGIKFCEENEMGMKVQKSKRDHVKFDCLKVIHGIFF